MGGGGELTPATSHPEVRVSTQALGAGCQPPHLSVADAGQDSLRTSGSKMHIPGLL